MRTQHMNKEKGEMELQIFTYIVHLHSFFAFTFTLQFTRNNFIK